MRICFQIAATLAAAASFGSAAAAQIVVAPAERPAVKMRYVVCWARVGSVRYVSEPVLMDENDFQWMQDAFEEAVLGSSKRFDDHACSSGIAISEAMSGVEQLRRRHPETSVNMTGWAGPFEIRGQLHRADGTSSAKSAQSSSKPKRDPKTTTVSAAPDSPKAAEKIPEYELRYQEELRLYNQRVAEREQRIRDLQQMKAQQEAKLLSDAAVAKQALQQHERELQQAEAAQRRYQEELAAHQAVVDRLQTKSDRDTKVAWREAIVVCTLNPSDGQSKFGNWRCDGPLQMTYAKLGAAGSAPSPQALVALSQACGGQKESVRDLGMVSSSHLFGCSFGLHPNSTSGFPIDAAAKHGIGFVPGRATYYCPAWKSGCRTR